MIYLNTPSEHAALYKQTARFEGAVFWDAPLETIEAGRPKEHIIQAKTQIPGVGEFTLSIVPNTRRIVRFDAVYRLLKCRSGEQDFCTFLPASIEASHFLTLSIKLAKSFRYGIVSVPEIQLKRDDPSTVGFGLLLSHNIVPSERDWATMRSNGKYDFVYALSNRSDAEEKNLFNLRELPFIQIDISFSDENRGYLILEKRSEGKRIVQETLTGWGPRYKN